MFAARGETTLCGVSEGFFVLHELRLPTGDLPTRLRAAARLADMPTARGERVLPLLVSIDDQRDVACLRRVHELPADDEAGPRIREALAPESEERALPRYYNERAAIAGERGDAGYYRMAVTESGSNDPAPTSAPLGGPVTRAPDSTSSAGDPAGAPLLWIGTPVARGTGLVVITGHHDAGAYATKDPQAWPLGTSRELGVRIYESARS